MKQNVKNYDNYFAEEEQSTTSNKPQPKPSQQSHQKANYMDIESPKNNNDLYKAPLSKKRSIPDTKSYNHDNNGNNHPNVKTINSESIISYEKQPKLKPKDIHMFENEVYMASDIHCNQILPTDENMVIDEVGNFEEEEELEEVDPQEKLVELEEQFNSNSLDFMNLLELIEVYQKLKLSDKLKHIRAHTFKYFPLPESYIKDWITDEYEELIKNQEVTPVKFEDKVKYLKFFRSFLDDFLCKFQTI